MIEKEYYKEHIEPASTLSEYLEALEISPHPEHNDLAIKFHKELERILAYQTTKETTAH